MKLLAPPKPITGRHMLAMFVGFFAVVIAVNFYMAFMAVHSWTGLVVENSYVASQKFNGDVTVLRKSAALGIAHHLHLENGKLQLKLSYADGKPVDANDVQISFERPVNASRAQALTATRASAGQYEAAALLSNGIWNGELSAKLNGDILWRQPFRLIVTGQ